MKSQKIISIPAGETAQQFYGCTNDICPICGEKFIAVSSVYKLGNVVYHLSCYVDKANGKL